VEELTLEQNLGVGQLNAYHNKAVESSQRELQAVE
jgi:hypothetical protein